MSHLSDDQIELYLLEPAQHVSWGQHVADCEDCRRRIEVSAHREPESNEGARSAECLECARPVVGTTCAHCGALRFLDGYQLESIKVQRGRGRLYIGRDAQAGRVAIKELAFAHAPGLEAVLAFEREAKMLRCLEHPGIPRFVASFTLGEGVHTRMYLVQELVEGESLHERLQHHQFSEAELVKLARDTLTIIDYLQSLTPMVFHRDVKPANLIRRHDGTIALVDFGAARDLGATFGATVVGTFGYMPVEQLTGIVDATTDLYAVGMTVLHLATRTEPWQLDARTQARAPLSRSFQAFLTRLTAKESADRYPSASAALKALDSPSRPPLTLRRAVIACAIGALAGGSGTYAGYRLLHKEPPAPEVVIAPLRHPSQPQPRPVPTTPAPAAPKTDERPKINYADRVPPVCKGGSCSLWVDARLSLDGVRSENGWLTHRIRPSQITVEAWMRPNPQVTLLWDPVVNVGISWGSVWAGIGTSSISLLNHYSHQSSNAWRHVAITYDGTMARLYLDAVEIASSRCHAECAPAELARGIVIGGMGFVDDVRLWSVARTQAQIRSDRDQLVPITTPGLVSSFSFDGDAKLPVQDDLGNNGPLTPTPPKMMRISDVSNMVVRVREVTPRGAHRGGDPRAIR